jgi:hypothetical protein
MSAENVDPYAAATKRDQAPPFGNGSGLVTTSIVSVGACPGFTDKHVMMVIAFIMTTFCYESVTKNLAENQPKALLFASTDPQRAFEVFYCIVKQAREVVLMVLKEAYKNDSTMKKHVQELISPGKVFGSYRSEVREDEANVIFVDPESPLLNPTLDELERQKKGEDVDEKAAANLQIKARKALHWMVLTVLFRQTESFTCLGPALLQKAQEDMTFYRNIQGRTSELYDALGRSQDGLNVNRVISSITTQLCYGCPAMTDLVDLITQGRAYLPPQHRDIPNWMAKMLGLVAPLARIPKPKFAIPAPPNPGRPAEIPAPTVKTELIDLMDRCEELDSVESKFPPIVDDLGAVPEAGSDGSGGDRGEGQSGAIQSDDTGTGRSNAPPSLANFSDYGYLKEQHNALLLHALELEELNKRLKKRAEGMLHLWQEQRNILSILAFDTIMAQMTKDERVYVTNIVKDVSGLDIRQPRGRNEISWEVLSATYHFLKSRDASQRPTTPSFSCLGGIARARNLPIRVSVTGISPKPKDRGNKKSEQQGKAKESSNRGGQSRPEKGAIETLRKVKEAKREQERKGKTPRESNKWATMETQLRQAVDADSKLIDSIKTARASTDRPCKLCPIIKEVATTYNDGSAEHHSGKGCLALFRTLTSLGVDPPVTTRKRDDKEKKRAGKRQKNK